MAAMRMPTSPAIARFGGAAAAAGAGGAAVGCNAAALIGQPSIARWPTTRWSSGPHRFRPAARMRVRRGSTHRQRLVEIDQSERGAGSTGIEAGLTGKDAALRGQDVQVVGSAFLIAALGS